MNKIFVVLSFIIVNYSFGMNTPENEQAKQLWDAISEGNQAKFHQLLADGASPLVPYIYVGNAGNTRRRLPVDCAISCYQYEMAAKLLETCPELQINGTPKECTLMEVVAVKGSYECIPLLRSHGAIVDEEVYRMACFTQYCTPERKQATIKEFKRILTSKTRQAASSGKTHND